MLALVQRRRQPAEVYWYKALRLCRRACAAVVDLARARQRQSLAQLDDHLLADIGLTREAQMGECSKSVWCL